MSRKIIVLVVLVGLPLGMMYPLWRSPVTAGEDDFVFYWPIRKLVAEQMRSGQVPLWNPYEACGVPLLADPQSAVLFPPHWLFLIVPPAAAYSACVFLIFMCAGGGAYVYLRRIGLGRGAAIFGAAAFAYCGFFLGHRAHLAMLQAAAMLGWGLWSIEKLRHSARSGFMWMAPIFALTLAAGHLPTVIHMSVVWLAYLLLRGRPMRRALPVAAGAVAVALLVMSPQLVATISYLNQSIRTGTPYVVAGENSFHPLCGVLAFFPAIMSNRGEGFFLRGYWGPWHLCEMLGYVGLVTLVLAAAGVRRLYRKRARGDLPIEPGPDAGGGPARPANPTPLVRVWTWILIGAGIWALGYYLPTYWPIYKIPIVGMVRCPARMLLTIGFGLSVLAAMTIQAVTAGGEPKLRRTIMRWAGLYLPVCMAACLLLLWALPHLESLGWISEVLWLSAPTPAQGMQAMREALHPLSSAVWLPVAMALAGAGVLWLFVRRPSRRAWMLTVLLLVDLFLVLRFVDALSRSRPPLVPERSPAAQWLRANAPKDQPFRVMGFSGSYHDRTAEFLLPMTCGGLGFESVSYYGPLQPTDHALMFGSRPWGENQDWRRLIRSNHLLSLFNVRYILGAGDEFRALMESVRIPATPRPPDGPNLLTDEWRFRSGRRGGEGIVLRAGAIWEVASAEQPVELTPGEVYRMGFDARAPAGAGNLVAARFVPDADKGARAWDDALMLRVDVEQLTPRWRHFEKAFRVPSGAGGRQLFEVLSHSIRPMEVRNITLCRSSWSAPINFAARLGEAEPVYVDLTPDGLEPVIKGDPRIHIYENRLCLPRRFAVREAVFFDDNEQVIEALRWRAGEYDLTRQVLMPRTDRPVADLEFVSERLGLLDGSAYVSANGLGAVRLVGVEAAGPSLPLWPMFVSAGGLGAYVAAGLLRRRRMNRMQAEDV